MYSLNAAQEHFAECSPAEQKILKELLREKLPDSPILSDIPVTDDKANIPPALADAVFSHREISPSALEKYAGCRFAYFCSGILKLREEPSDTFSGREVGIFIHFVLEKAIEKMREAGGAGNISEPETDALITRISDEYLEKLTGAIGELTPRKKALFARLTLVAGIVARGLFAEFADSLFTPAFTELNLNADGKTPVLTLSGGRTVPLTGKADRVDFWVSEDKKAYFRVVDYKTTEHKFKPEAVKDGVSIQMPLYLMALCKSAHPTLCEKLGLPLDTVFYPAGITYVTVGGKTDTTDSEVPREAALKTAVEGITRHGVFLADEAVQHAFTPSGNVRIFGAKKKAEIPGLSQCEFDAMFGDLSLAVENLTDNMKAGLADATPRVYAGQKPCDFCAFGAVCRAAQKSKH